MKKLNNLLGFAAVVLATFILANPVSAEDAGNATSSPLAASTTAPIVRLTIRYQEHLVFDDTISVPTSTIITYHRNGETDTLATTTARQSVLAALVQADQSVTGTSFAVSDLAYYDSFGSYLLNCLTLTSPVATDACYNWQYVVNDVYPFVGMDQFDLTGGEHVYLYFGERYRLTSNTSTASVGQTVTTTLTEYIYTTHTYSPASGTVGLLDATGTAVTTSLVDAQGQAQFTPSLPGSYSAGLQQGSHPWTYYWPQVSFTAHWPTRLMIRYQDQILFDARIPLPTSTTFSYHNTGNTTTIATSTVQPSVLATLLQADMATSTFSVSDLTYYPSFGSFFVTCIHIITTTTTEACSNWQYVVNDNYPFVGMDQYLLAGGESVSIYFGDRYLLTTDQTSYQLGQSVTGTIREYDYQNHIYSPLPKAALGLLDSIGTILATSTVNQEGQGIFLPTTTGTYEIGLDAGGYWWPKASFTVTSTTQGDQSPPVTGGCNRCGPSPTPSTTSIEANRALQFLSDQQNPDGSFGNGTLYTDWAAIALSTTGTTMAARQKVVAYLLTDVSPGNLVTDAERRAMALMALGINPYTGVSTNYIQPILNAYDGRQIGDINLVNDDIFALFSLLKAGYSLEDNIIRNTITFIITQKQNGSWGGVDLTAAAIQALTQVQNAPGVSGALTEARTYLHTRQGINGSFDNNIDSTSWATQAIIALGESPHDAAWKPNGLGPIDYLSAQQQADGGMRTPNDTKNNRVWSTSYAVPAAIGRPWGALLSAFNRPTGSVTSGGSPCIGCGGPPPEDETVQSTSTTATTSPIDAPQVTTSTSPFPSNATTSAQISPTVTSTRDREPQAVSTTARAVTTIASRVERVSAPQIKSSTNTKAQVTAKTNTLTSSTSPTTNTIIITGTSTPLYDAARNVSRTAFTLAGIIGIFLVWRLVQTLV